VKNADLWKSYSEYTSDLTKHSRQMAFGGIAICWFFRSAEVTFPPLILGALFAFVVYFALDVSQHTVAAWKLRRWTLDEEQRQWDEAATIDGEYELPAKLDRIPFRLFLLKTAVLLIAFATLSAELLRRT